MSTTRALRPLLLLVGALLASLTIFLWRSGKPADRSLEARYQDARIYRNEAQILALGHELLQKDPGNERVLRDSSPVDNKCRRSFSQTPCSSPSVRPQIRVALVPS